jgi:hypothetical protein
MGGSGKWLRNYARNANKLTPVALAITTKKVNAPRRLVPMRLLDLITRQLKTKTRKIEFVTIRSKCAPGATTMCGNLPVQKVEFALQQEGGVTA